MRAVNIEVKAYAKERGVFLWEVAKEMNVSEATMMRKLREQLSVSDNRAFIAAVDKIVEERRKGC